MRCPTEFLFGIKPRPPEQWRHNSRTWERRGGPQSERKRYLFFESQTGWPLGEYNYESTPLRQHRSAPKAKLFGQFQPLLELQILFLNRRSSNEPFWFPQAPALESRRPKNARDETRPRQAPPSLRSKPRLPDRRPRFSIQKNQTSKLPNIH